jgi:flagellar biosynthetic protein FliR
MTLEPGDIGALICASFRVSGLVLTAPVIGEGGVPARAKLVFVIAAALGLGMNRGQVAYDEVPANALLELVVGLLTGLSAKFVIARVAVAGQLMGLSLGLGFASSYDIHAGESAGTMRTLASTLAGLAFVMSGGLEALVRGAATPAHPTDLVGLGASVMSEGVACFGRGVAIAAPIILASAVGNLGIAVMNRAAPAVNVFSVALPAVLCLGGILLLNGTGGFVGSCIETSRDAIAHLLGR